VDDSTLIKNFIGEHDNREQSALPLQSSSWLRRSKGGFMILYLLVPIIEFSWPSRLQAFEQNHPNKLEELKTTTITVINIQTSRRHTSSFIWTF